MSNYYVITSESSRGKEYSPIYLWVINGEHMFQSNLYDATKFTSEELAQKRIGLLKELHPEGLFDIIPVDYRIFGMKPRNVINFEAGYISHNELEPYYYGKDIKRIQRSYGDFPKGFFKSPDCALSWYDSLYDKRGNKR